MRVAHTGQHLAQHADGEQRLFGGRCQRHAAGRPCAPAGTVHRSAIVAGQAAVHGRRRVAAPHAHLRAGAIARARRTGHTGDGVAHGLHALLAQAAGGALVNVHQLLAQLFAHLGHPLLAHLGRHAGVGHHLLQCADVVLGPQWVALGLDAAQALSRADQCVQLGQRRLRGQRSHLLGARHLHLGQHLGIVHQRQFAEVDARVAGRGPLRARLRRAFGKGFQQRHRVTLDQLRLMLVQQAQRIARLVAPLDVTAGGLLLAQRTAGARHQLLHQRLAVAYCIDDACAKNRSGARRWQGHGSWEKKGGAASRPILLPQVRHLSAL